VPLALNKAEMADLREQLRAGPRPATCRDARALIRQEHNIAPAQVGDVASMAWPDLCPPPPAAVAPSPAPAPRPRESLVPRAPLQTAPLSGRASIDQQYAEQTARLCSSGMSGLRCRDTVRRRLCNGRWTNTPPPGQTVCHAGRNTGLVGR
jgi:hypothetical protein